MDQINENIELLKLPFNKKLKIAIKTIITGQLKDNHDDTLFEKLCTFFESEIGKEGIQQFVIEENIFELIDSNLPLINDVNDLAKFKDELIILFRISGSLFSLEEIFNLYSNCRVPNILNLIEKNLNDLSEANIVNFSLFSFLNDITKHYSGVYWLSSLINNNLHQNSNVAIDQFIRLLQRNNTHFIQEKVYSVIANLINNINKLPSALHENFTLSLNIYVFNEFEDFTSEFTWHVLSLISDGESFILKYKIIDLIKSKLPLIKLSSCLVKLVSLIVNICPHHSTCGICELINLTIQKLYSTDNCFIFVSFLSSILNVKHYIGDSKIFARSVWISYMNKFLNLMKKHYSIEFVECSNLQTIDSNIINNTFNTISYCNFEINCFKELLKIKVETIDNDHLLSLIIELRHIIVNVSNLKHITFVILFFEEIIKAKHEDINVINQIALIYCDLLLSRMTTYPNLILKSIRIMIESCSLFQDELFLIRIAQILSSINERLKNIDLSNDNELLEMFVEIIYQIVLHLDYQYLIHNSSDNVSQICETLSLNLELQSTIIQNDDTESYTRACIISTLYLISLKGSDLFSKFKELKFNDLISNFENYDLTFKQSFLFNLKNILFLNPNLRCLGHLELNFFCKNCMNENDCELQLLLLKIINLICQAHIATSSEFNLETCKLFQMSGIFALILFLLNEPLVSYQIKLDTVGLNENLRNYISQHIDSANLQLDIDFKSTVDAELNKVAFEFCLSPDVDFYTMIEKYREHPKLNILDDIISTSLLSQDMVMDCY